MRSPALYRAIVCVCACATLALLPCLTHASVYHDRTLFTSALAAFPSFTDNYESYSSGTLASGGALGDFLYTFDSAVTEAAVVSDGAGGQALGGSPFDVFVGGDSVALIFEPLSLPDSPPLFAFGLDFAYGPSFDVIPADTYRLTVGDGPAAARFAGNLELDPAGGTFFLGIILGPADAFNSVLLSSLQSDPNVLVPAYQVDNVVYAAVVPEPTTVATVGIGCLAMLFRAVCRRTNTTAVN